MRLQGYKDQLNRQRKKEDPGDLAIVTGVVPGQQNGNSVYRVHVAIINSGTANVEFETSTVNVEGGEMMEMSNGGEAPSEWNSEGTTDEEESETQPQDGGN